MQVGNSAMLPICRSVYLNSWQSYSGVEKGFSAVLCSSFDEENLSSPDEIFSMGAFKLWLTFFKSLQQLSVFITIKASLAYVYSLLSLKGRWLVRQCSVQLKTVQIRDFHMDLSEFRLEISAIKLPWGGSGIPGQWGKIFYYTLSIIHLDISNKLLMSKWPLSEWFSISIQTLFKTSHLKQKKNSKKILRCIHLIFFILSSGALPNEFCNLNCLSYCLTLLNLNVSKS